MSKKASVDWSDILFQADCSVREAWNGFEEGGKIVAYDRDDDCLVIDDGDGWQVVAVQPIRDLIEAIDTLPPKPPGGY